jgi:hypothetical protein
MRTIVTAPLATGNERAAAVRDYARQCNGTECWHRHRLLRNFYHTDGIDFLASTCGAYWLVDLVASHQRGIFKRHGGLARFQVWRLEKVSRCAAAGSEWRATAWSDSPGKSAHLASQRFDYSDFPDELLDERGGFEFYVERGSLDGETPALVMMLKEER